MIKKVLQTIAALASVVFIGQAAIADPVSIPAGGQSAFSPTGDTACSGAVTNNSARPTAEAQAECLLDAAGLWGRVSAASGSGAEAVDIAAQTTILVGHFQVDTPEGATADGYLPVNVSVPVEWTGVLANPQTAVGSTADINMYLRLREADAADPTLPGALVSQTRFQGATHAGSSGCASVPAGHVSAANMVVRCMAEGAQADRGGVAAEVSGVLRTGQAYAVELIAHAGIMTELNGDAGTGFEEVNFFSNADDATVPAGMLWAGDATVAVGTDAGELVAEVRDELSDLQDEVDVLTEQVDELTDQVGELTEQVATLERLLAELRHDFDGHYHTYLTGRGTGHNNTVAETPPPTLPPPLPPAPDPAPAAGEEGDDSGAVNTATGQTTTGTGNASGVSAPTGTTTTTSFNDTQSGGGGGAFGLPMLLALAGTLLFRRRAVET